MKRILAAAIFCALSAPAFAACPATLQLKDNAGVTPTAKYLDDGSGNCLAGIAAYGWGGLILGAPSNYGSSPGAVLVPGVNAFVTNSNVNGAAAIANSSPVTAATINVTPTDCSSTVATGGTAVNAISAGATLHGATIQNIDTTEGMWISLTGTAAASTAGSYFLQPGSTTVQGGTYTTPLGLGFNTNLSVVAATNGHKFTCTKW